MTEDWKTKPPAYWDDATPVFRASAFGRCAQALARYLRGDHACGAPEGLLKAGEWGSLLEPFVISILRHARFYCPDEYNQHPVELSSGPALIRGHIDGIVTADLDDDPHFRRILWEEYPALRTWDGSPAVLEVKTRNQEWYDAWMEHGLEAIPSVAWQIMVYSLGLSLDFWDADFAGTRVGRVAPRRDSGQGPGHPDRRGR